MRISEKRLICAIKDANRIRLIRLFKNLLSFLIFNFVIPISSFSIMLAARFSLFIFFKCCIQLLRRKRRLIRKRGDITGIVYRLVYLYIDMLRYDGAYIRSAALSRLGLAPYPPLAKSSADP
jgi:hypothetical protein